MAQVNLGRVVGYSAYEIAVQNGFEGTEAEWLASLKGDKGDTGAQGPQGETGPQGPAGPTYTAGTGIDITNNVISATGGSGGGMDEDDVKDLIHEEYGMSKVVGAESLRSISGTLGDALNISASELNVWTNSWTEFRSEMPEIKVHINSMANVFSDVDAIVAPGEGGMGGQAYQAMYVNGKWVNNYWDTTPEYILNLNFVYDFNEQTMETSNIRLDSITLHDGSYTDVAGSFDVNIYKISFNKLNNDFIDNTVWASRDSLYNDQKAQEFIATAYGAAPGTEEWRTWEEEAIVDDGRVDVEIDHDPLNFNDINLFDDMGETHIGYFQYDDSSFVYYDTETGLESEDFGLSYNDIDWTLHLTGDDGTYILRQNYAEQIAPTPFNVDYIPDEVFEEIDRVDGKVDALIPSYTASDAGKALTVNQSGNGVEWATASGGSSMTILSTNAVAVGNFTAEQQSILISALTDPALAASIIIRNTSNGVDYVYAGQSGSNYVQPNIFYWNPQINGGYRVWLYNGALRINAADNGGNMVAANSIYLAAGYNPNPSGGFTYVDSAMQYIRNNYARTADIKQVPTVSTATDGTFVLTATVSSGVSSYGWDTASSGSASVSNPITLTTSPITLTVGTSSINGYVWVHEEDTWTDSETDPEAPVDYTFNTREVQLDTLGLSVIYQVSYNGGRNVAQYGSDYLSYGLAGGSQASISAGEETLNDGSSIATLTLDADKVIPSHLMLASPDGSHWELTVSNTGVLSVTQWVDGTEAPESEEEPEE